MSLYDGPRSVSKHLAELEDRWGRTGRRHQNTELRGWQAERHLAQVRYSEQKKHNQTLAPNVLKLLTAKMRTWLKMFGTPNELKQSNSKP